MLHAEAGQAVAYKGMLDCFSRTLSEEGFRALFKVGEGVLPAILGPLGRRHGLAHAPRRSAWRAGVSSSSRGLECTGGLL